MNKSIWIESIWKETVNINRLREFLEVVKGGNFPKELYLSGNVSLENIIILVKTLTSTKTPCPAGFLLKLEDNVDAKKAIVLSGILQSKQCPKDLVLDLSLNDKFGVPEAKAFANALKSNRSRCMELVLSGTDIDDEGAKALADSLTYLPENFRLFLGSNNITDKGAEAFANALETGRCRKGLTLNLMCNPIGDKGAKDLARAIRSGKCPEGFSLLVYDTEMTNIGFNALTLAMGSGFCPRQFVLDVSSAQINVEAIRGLVDSLRGEHGLLDLKLYLRNNNLRDKELEILTELFEANPYLPPKLLLDLGYNKISSVGAKALVRILKTSHCQTLKLDLRNNNITDEGTEDLAEALGENCPKDLTLKLQNTGITDKGAVSLAKVLQRQRDFSTLYLYLDSNKISNTGAIAFVDVFKRIPWKLEFFIDNNAVDEDVQQTLKQAYDNYLKNNYNNLQACVAFQQGMRQSESPINQLTQEIIREIFSYLLPLWLDISGLTLIASVKAFLKFYANDKSTDQLRNIFLNILFRPVLDLKIKKREISEKIDASINSYLREVLKEYRNGKQYTKSTLIDNLRRFHLIRTSRLMTNFENTYSWDDRNESNISVP